MGRGSGNNPRNVLLQKKRRRQEEILFDHLPSEGTHVSYIDSDGNRVIRDYADRASWVERIEEDGRETLIYAYRDPDIDIDPVGDSVLVETVRGDDFKTTYSDGTLFQNNYDKRDTCVQETRYRGGGSQKIYSWVEGDDVFKEEHHESQERTSIQTYKNNLLHGEPGVAAERSWDKKDILRSESFAFEGSLKSINDQPSKRLYDMTGGIETEEWIGEGGWHRVGGPARIKYYPTGEVSGEEFYVKGERYNPDGPVELVRYRSGGVSQEIYRYAAIVTYGDRAERKTILGTKEGGPGAVEYYENGAIKSQRWYNYTDYTAPEDLKNYSNTDGKPARIDYYENSQRKEVLYMEHGILRRDDGPAKIRYSEAGEATYEEFWLDGEEVTYQEYVRRTGYSG